MTVSDITLDGNSGNSIRFFNEIDNYLAVFTGTNSSLFKSMEIRNSPAHGLTIEDSRRVSIENCTFVDGSLTDRYPFEPLGAQESEVLRVNDSLFENYPGPVDLSVTSVVSTGGNIIRNCGTGLRTLLPVRSQLATIFCLDLLTSSCQHQIFMIVTLILSISRSTLRQTSMVLSCSTSRMDNLRILVLLRLALYLLVLEQLLDCIAQQSLKLLVLDSLSLTSRPSMLTLHSVERKVTYNLPCRSPRLAPCPLVSHLPLDITSLLKNIWMFLQDSQPTLVSVPVHGLRMVHIHRCRCNRIQSHAEQSR